MHSVRVICVCFQSALVSHLYGKGVHCKGMVA